MLAEASFKGRLWIRGSEQGKIKKMLKVPTEMLDKIMSMNFDSKRNLLWISSKDGNMKCYKIPKTPSSSNSEEQKFN